MAKEIAKDFLCAIASNPNGYIRFKDDIPFAIQAANMLIQQLKEEPKG